VAITLKDGVCSLYTNGLLAATGAVAIPPASINPALNYLGKSQFPDPLFGGRLDQFVLYNYALNAAQIAQVYATSTAGSLPLPKLLHRWNFNETNGATAFDSVGGANAALQGGATFDGLGRVVLDGTSGAFVALPGVLLAGLTSVTLEAWVTNAVAPDNVALFSFDNGLQNGSGGGCLRYVLHDQSNGRNFLELASGGGSPLLPGNPGLGGQYVHVVCVYNAGAGVELIYTNGVLEAAQPIVAPLGGVSQNAAALGRSPWSTDPWLNGAIDEFRIYGGQLLPGDIAAAQQLGPDVLLTANATLSVTPGGAGALMFTWPLAAPGFTLQSSPVLGVDAAWAPVNNATQISGQNYQVLVAPPDATRFFRLVR